MSEPFIDPASTSWQNLNLYNELALSIQDHELAVWGGALFDLFEKDDFAQIGFLRTGASSVVNGPISAMQLRLALLVERGDIGLGGGGWWLDPSDDLNGADGSAYATFEQLLYAKRLSLQDVFDLAGLPDGFRRVREWDGVGTPNFVYGGAESLPGLAVVDDVIGYWLFDDIAAFLSVLVRVWYSDIDVEWDFMHSQRFGTGQDLVCETALAAAKSDYDAWGDDDRTQGYLYLSRRNRGGDTIFTSERMRSTPQITTIPLVVGATYGWNFYLWPDRSYPNRTADEFESIDYPTMEEDIVYLWDSGAGVETDGPDADTITALTIGDIETNPLDLIPVLDCASPDTDAAVSVSTENAAWVVDWHFSKVNEIE